MKAFKWLLISVVLFSCTYENTHVLIKTKYGDIVVELYPEKAPLTCNNFVRYIEEGRLEDATFYRTVTSYNQPDSETKIEIIQGGLFEDHHPQMLPPIPHESTEQTGILHKNGTISMARYEPGTATSEFFICIGDQPALDQGGKRNPDEQGFAAFGRVIQGMGVVRSIQQQPAKDQYLQPPVRILQINIL